MKHVHLTAKRKVQPEVSALYFKYPIDAYDLTSRAIFKVYPTIPLNYGKINLGYSIMNV